MSARRIGNAPAVVMRTRVPPEDLARYEEAAALCGEGKTLSDFVRAACDAYAERVEDQAHAVEHSRPYTEERKCPRCGSPMRAFRPIPPGHLCAWCRTVAPQDEGDSNARE